MTEDQKGEEIRGKEQRQPIFMLPLVITALGGVMLAIQAASALDLTKRGSLISSSGLGLSRRA